VCEDNNAQWPSTVTDENKHMETRIEIVQLQLEIVPAATHLAQLAAHFQVLVQRQQFFYIILVHLGMLGG
jgi:hypothetical protein